MSVLIAVGLFLVGAALAVWATERLLEGLVSLAAALRLSAFAVGAVLSGFEARDMPLRHPSSRLLQVTHSQSLQYRHNLPPQIHHGAGLLRSEYAG